MTCATATQILEGLLATFVTQRFEEKCARLHVPGTRLATGQADVLVLENANAMANQLELGAKNVQAQSLIKTAPPQHAHGSHRAVAMVDARETDRVVAMLVGSD